MFKLTDKDFVRTPEKATTTSSPKEKTSTTKPDIPLPGRMCGKPDKLKGLVKAQTATPKELCHYLIWRYRSSSARGLIARGWVSKATGKKVLGLNELLKASYMGDLMAEAGISPRELTQALVDKGELEVSPRRNNVVLHLPGGKPEPAVELSAEEEFDADMAS